MKLNFKHLVMAILAISCLLNFLSAVASEDYPTKPVRVLVGFSPGAVNDIAARIVASALSAKFGRPFVVENRLGANGLIASAAVAKSKADGYTLLAANSSAMTVNPLMYKNPPYDTLKDFIPISPAAEGYFIVATNPTNPRTTSVASFTDLIALAKAKPGTLTYSTAGAGNYGHLGTELLSFKSGISAIHVPYSGGLAASQTALIAGEVDFSFIIASTSSFAQIKSGKLRAVAVTMPKRSLDLPDVPAIAEFYPGFDVTFWIGGFFAPAGTPDHVVRLLNQEIVAATNQPEVRERLLRVGNGILALSPEAFTARISADLAQNGEVIRRANITAD